MIAATVLLIVAWLLIPRHRRRSAAERHLMWACALAAATLIPVLVWLLPRSGPLWVGAVLQTLPPSLSGLGATSDGMVVHAYGLSPAEWSWVDALRSIWAAGTATCAGLLAWRLFRLRAITNAATRVVDGDLHQCMALAARRLGVGSRGWLLARSAVMAVPGTWGWFPRVLLPAGVERWPRQQLELILLHELAHVRRHDWAAHMLAEVSCALFWFNPMFWLARRELRRESEHAADDMVLSTGENPAAYAAVLIDVIRAAQRLVRPHATVAMANGREVSDRITSVLAVAANRSPLSRPRLVAALLATAVIAYGATMVSTPTFAAEVRMLPPHLPSLLQPTRAVDDDGPLPPSGEVRIVHGAAPGVVPPQIAEYTTPPLYSDDARRRRREGIVTVRAHVNDSGSLEGAHVVKGLGSGLDENALVAVRQWRFTPARIGSRPIALDVDVDVQFSLEHEALNELIANDMATQVGPGVVPPRVVRTQRPVVEAGAEGRVVLDVVVREDGTPRIVRILESGGEALDEAAVHAFEAWRFTPASRDGHSVRVRMTAEIALYG